MKKMLFLLLSGFSCIIYAQEFTDLYGDYLGQTPPGKKAVKFAPGIISLPNRAEYNIAFSPDCNECYFTCRIESSNKIYFTKRINNTWAEPKDASFSVNQSVVLSNLSVDGKKLYFENDDDILMVERSKSGWCEPQHLPSPINSTSNDHSYCETVDGVVYIGSNRPGGLGKYLEIWCVRKKPDQSLYAENLGPIVNSTLRNLTPCVAPDGSYLIFTQSDTKYEHLCISFNKGNGEWTIPIDMDAGGACINSLFHDRPTFQNRATLSPDGKYLFFNSHDPASENASDIYWVSTEIINDLKKISERNSP